MSEYYAHVQQMTKMLNNLDKWLDKAEEHAKAKSFDPEILLQARLAPDMFPLVQQIQTVCDGVKFLAARMSGKEAPKHPDTEKTLPEIRARIRSVQEYVATFQAADFAGADKRVIALSFMPGKGLAAQDWLLEFNLSNTYFHLGMTYAILRHNGVALGKQDYIGSFNLRDL
jgi:hypothetical protein